MVKTLPPNPNLEYEKKQAKTLLKALHAGDPAALSRLWAVHPRFQNGAERATNPADFKLSDAQLVIAREYDLSSWPQLKHQIEIIRAGLQTQFDQFAAAVRKGDAAHVGRLLDATPGLAERINDPAFSFDTPALVSAVGAKNRPLIDVLLNHGADPNVQSSWWAGGFGVLHNTDPALAQTLIERGAAVDVHAAAEQGMLDVLTRLIEADPALVDAKGPDGQRPLHFARSTAVIDFLLAHGADIDARDVDHSGTAAQWLVKDHPELCRTLLQRGATPDLYMACALGDIERVRQILADDPAALDRRIGVPNDPLVPRAPGLHIYAYVIGDNVSPFQIALHWGHRAVYDLLLESSTPIRRFIAACERGDLKTLRSILAEQPEIVASLPVPDRRLLADAAWENRLDMVRALLDAGFDPHWRGADESTPLDRAAFHGFYDVVALLLQHNPPLTLTNAYGGRPLDAAIYGSIHSWRRDGNFPATVEALIQAGSTIKPESFPSGNAAVDVVLRKYMGD